MLKLLNGKDSFYQWDLNQKIEVTDSTVTEVHFSNTTKKEALICEVYEENGKKLVNVPNILLQEVWDILAYAYCGECYTKQHARYKVIERSKPADYVYTETEVKSYTKLEEKITEVIEDIETLTNENSIQDRKIKALEDNQGNFYAEQTYNPESPLAQSGKAVAEALATVQPTEKEWQLIEDITLTEAVQQITVARDKLDYQEVHIEALIIPNDTAITSQQISLGTGGYNLWMANGNPKATGKLYFTANLYLTPDKKPFCDGTLSSFFYSLSGASFTAFGYNFMKDTFSVDTIKDVFNANGKLRFVSSTENGLGIGTKFKVWGR